MPHRLPRGMLSSYDGILSCLQRCHVGPHTYRRSPGTAACGDGGSFRRGDVTFRSDDVTSQLTAECGVVTSSGCRHLGPAAGRSRVTGAERVGGPRAGISVGWVSGRYYSVTQQHLHLLARTHRLRVTTLTLCVFLHLCNDFAIFFI